MSHGFQCSTEHLKFMSFKYPNKNDLSKHWKDGGGESDTLDKENESNTFFVILNQNEVGKSIPYPVSLVENKNTTRMKDSIKHSRRRFVSHSNDSLRLNLNNGFDSYDSSNIAQKVFQERDNIDDEGFSGTPQRPHQMKPNILQDKQLPVKIPLSRTGIGDTSEINFTRNTGLSVTNMSFSSCDVTGCSSGYNSANSSNLPRESFETPSPVSLPTRHHTARKIFQKSSPLDQRLNNKLLSTGSVSQSLNSSQALCDTSALQSNSFMNYPNVRFSSHTPRTSTPMSGYVVQASNGHKFILPVNPKLTQTVRVSKSDSHINIEPMNIKQLVKNDSSGHSSGAQTGKRMITHDEKELNNKKQNDTDCLHSDISLPMSPKNKIVEGKPTPMGKKLFSKEKLGNVDIKYSVNEKENIVKVETEDPELQETKTVQEPDSKGSQDDALSNSQESEKDSLNDSLTNIQWLGGMQLKEDGKAVTVTQNKKDPALQWKCLSRSEVERIAKEYGKSKRPPFSYMTLIQMALNSREDKRMTLREICQWIEEMFPFYEKTAKPGWKNSIRHNLSLYSIFEREKTKKHGSYWTIKEDCPEKAKVLPLRDKRELASKLPNSLPVTFIPHQSSTVPKLPISNKFSSHYQDGHRRNLQPILPRPGLYSPLQTYALIPIQNLNQSQRISNSQSQPMLIQVPANPQVLSQNTKHDPGSFQSKKVCDKTSKKKVVNIAPKCSSPNIVRQAWINAQTYSDSENEKLGNTKHCNISKKGSDQASAKKKKQNNGLPKPKIYSKNSSPKRVKARRKQKLIPKERDLMNDSSDEDMKDFMSKIEQDLPTPLRKILDGSDTENEKVTTSTPLKNASHPAELPSPIKGITPLKGVSLLDSSFLDCFKDSDNEDRKSVFGSPNFITGMKRNSMGQLGSPSQFDNLFSGLTPIKGELDSSNNENLSRFLSEFPLVESMETEDDCLSNSLAGMNWSAIYQHIGSTPNSKK